MDRRLKERQSPHCTILMGQRLRDRECEFVSNGKYGTVQSKNSLVSIGPGYYWIIKHYPSNVLSGWKKGLNFFFLE
jgi:hypothetical protein